jgi:hypothetical protein
MSTHSEADVSDVLGASGDCPRIVVGEDPNQKTWLVSWPTQKAKTRLNNLFIGMAEQNVNESSAGLSPARRAQADKDFSEAMRRGDYKTWGAGWLAEYQTPRGQVMFLLSLLQEKHPTATEADAIALFRDKGGEVTRALLRVAPPFFSLMIDDMPTAPMADPEALLAFKMATIGQMMAQIQSTLASFQLQHSPLSPTG